MRDRPNDTYNGIFIASCNRLALWRGYDDFDTESQIELSLDESKLIHIVADHMCHTNDYDSLGEIQASLQRLGGHTQGENILLLVTLIYQTRL